MAVALARAAVERVGREVDAGLVAQLERAAVVRALARETQHVLALAIAHAAVVVVAGEIDTVVVASDQARPTRARAVDAQLRVAVARVAAGDDALTREALRTAVAACAAAATVRGIVLRVDTLGLARVELARLGRDAPAVGAHVVVVAEVRAGPAVVGIDVDIDACAVARGRGRTTRVLLRHDVVQRAAAGEHQREPDSGSDANGAMWRSRHRGSAVQRAASVACVPEG